MDQPAPIVHWGFILISLPNLVLILVMLLLFGLALILPFPAHRKRQREESTQVPVTLDPSAAAVAIDDPAGGWTNAVRRNIAQRLPLTEVLPTRQPYYVGSWVYVFSDHRFAGLGSAQRNGARL
jgi:hypothetical protein